MTTYNIMQKVSKEIKNKIKVAKSRGQRSVYWEKTDWNKLRYTMHFNGFLKKDEPFYNGIVFMGILNYQK